MTIRHHRIKTFGRWQVQQPFPGLYLYYARRSGAHREAEIEKQPRLAPVEMLEHVR